MFGLGIVPKKIFLAYSTQYLFNNKTCTWKRGHVRHLYMQKKPHHGGVDICNYVKTCYFNIFVLFIVDTTSILKLVFPTVYCFWHDGYFGGCVVVIVTVAVVVFIYLFICLSIYLFYFFVNSFIHLFISFSATSTVILIFVVVAVIATVALVVGVIVIFCACLVIVVANLMLMFTILVLLSVPCFTVNSVGKSYKF